MNRYFLKADFGKWTEVAKDKWVQAERSAGFHNTMGRPEEPGTGGFSGRGVSGRIVDMEYYNPEHYDDEFRALLTGIAQSETYAAEVERGIAALVPFARQWNLCLNPEDLGEMVDAVLKAVRGES